MAILTFNNQDSYYDNILIQEDLAKIGIQVKYWNVDPECRSILENPDLTAEQMDFVLDKHVHYFQDLQSAEGYKTQDMICLHGDMADIDDQVELFSRSHYHDDDEVRFVVDGEGSFGFFHPDGRHMLLTMQAGEYINVPAGMEHWFRLTPLKRIKTIRYFKEAALWSAEFTDKKTAI